MSLGELSAWPCCFSLIVVGGVFVYLFFGPGVCVLGLGVGVVVALVGLFVDSLR